MKYIPHANYPKSQKSFNIIKMMPGLFKGIDFRDLALIMGNERANDCFDGITFLFASKYQENDGAKLVMMLSAIERTTDNWIPLETFLRRKDVKKEIKQSKNGVEAYRILENKIEEYLNSLGSTRSIVNFFLDNLTNRDKRIFTGGIRRAFSYKKQQLKNMTLFKPTYEYKNESIDTELARLLKKFIYDIRNNFVHKANYIIIPNKKYMKERKIFELDMYEEGLPKEHWITILSFETLHGLFCRAFIKYWRKEYFKKKKETVK